MTNELLGNIKGLTGDGLEFIIQDNKVGIRVKPNNGSTSADYSFTPDLKGATGDTGTPGVDGATGAKGDTGKQGYTFTPHITETDNKINLSWTNDGLQTNPQTINIRGPQGIQGEQGIQGPQGIQGLTGEKGDPATGVSIGSYYWFYVDNNGDLYLEGEDVSSDDFYYDTSTGNLYKNYNTNAQLLLGNVKGPKGDTQDLTAYYTKTEVDTNLNLKSDKTDVYTKAEVDALIATLQESIDAINTEETTQNTLLGTQ